MRGCSQPRGQTAHLGVLMPCACTWKHAFSLRIHRCSEHCSIQWVLLSVCQCTVSQYSSLQRYNHCARRKCSLQGPVTSSSISGAGEEATQESTQDMAANHSVAHPLNYSQLRSVSSRAVLSGSSDSSRGKSPHRPTLLNRAQKSSTKFQR